jgi:hypothetical protein
MLFVSLGMFLILQKSVIKKNLFHKLGLHHNELCRQCTLHDVFVCIKSLAKGSCERILILNSVKNQNILSKVNKIILVQEYLKSASHSVLHG